ncbi:hypothetical protein [Prochlorococcus marinus]|uniref:Uncharacterized protein n=1 Tax=Prochlorococcus marinus (strain MIT 9211) TaxID=93059 RepID=A9B9J0_PROM4|nr:hypothetical protein [Prochlorococcus marinus]ABX07965.1 Hypothetical protein P9211_00341 [Prochlorococcus marinus str. MIT 9211]
MSSSCSFRITRTAEDLAQTLAAISQRLVKLEQRLEALETQSNQSEVSQTDEEIVMLDGVDQLLQECKGLLNTSTAVENNDEFWTDDTGENQEIAA